MAWAAVAGAAVGGLINRGSRGGSTTTQSADPWSGAQPGLRTLYDSAVANFNGPGPQYFPGRTVAGQSDTTLDAQNQLQQRAGYGNQLLDKGQQEAQRTLGGEYFRNNPATANLMALGQRTMNGVPGMDGLNQTANGSFLNANPYVDQMFGQASKAVGEQFSKNVMPGIASMFAGGGRFGSNQMAEGMGQAQGRYGDTLNSLATSIYGGNYANERARQQQAQAQLGSFDLQNRNLQLNAYGEIGTQFGRERVLQGQAMNQSPQLSQADYFDLGQLANLGEAKDQYSQRNINAEMDRWNFNQNAPNAELAFLNSIMQNSPGGSRTTNERGNPLMAAAGGAQLGQSIFNGYNAAKPVMGGYNNGFYGAGINPNSGEYYGSLEF